MQVAPGIFKHGLPNVIVDQVIFDSIPEKGVNDVKIDFLYRIPSTWTKTTPYRVMVIMTDDDSIIQKFMQHESYAKHCILDDTKQTSDFMKVYLLGDESGGVKSFDEITLLDPKLATGIAQKKITFRPAPLDQGLWPNLYIYAVAYAVNPQDITNSGVSTKIKSIKLGTPAVETIYVSNRASPVGIVYTLQETVAGYGKEGEIWDGPVHIHQGTTMAGSRHDATEHHPPLKINTVSNQKLQDKSFMRQQDRLLSGLTKQMQTLNSRITKDFEVARNIVKKGNNGVSDAHYSRTTGNVLKVLFSINYKHFVQANTKMNFLFTNKEALNSCFKVENIRVFRTRIRMNISSNSLTPGKLNICGVKQLESPKLVSSITDRTVSTINFANQAPGVTTYVATDIEMSSKDMGVYEYSLHMDAVDNSAHALHTFMKGLNIRLIAYISWLKRAFYEKGFGGKHAVSQRVQMQSKFLQQDKAWKELIDYYLSCVTFIFGHDAFGQQSIDEWRKNLLAMANPINGNTESMHEVAELVSRFYSSINAMINPSTLGKSNQKFSVRSKINSMAPNAQRISFHMVFPNVYQNKSDAQTGFDYLDETLVQQGPALSGLSFAAFNTRINNEIGKFGVSAPNSQQVNKPGYLTPARIKTPTNIIETNTFQVGIDNITDLLHAKKKPQTPALSFQVTNSPLASPSEETTGLLRLSGISIQPLKEDITLTRNLSTPTLSMATDLQLTDSSKYLSTGSAFASEDTYKSAQTSGSTEQNIQYAFPLCSATKAAIQESALAKSLINSQVASFTQKVAVKNIIGIAGSLAAKKISDNPFIVQENNLATSTISLNSVQQVQYFQGFATNPEGDILLDQPLWNIMTKEIYNQAQSNNSLLLCRLQPTTNVTNGGNSLDLEGYDNLFMIGSLPTAPGRRAHLPYRGYFRQVESVLHRTTKNVTSNIDTPLANVAPSQITLPLLPPVRISDKSVVKIGMSTTMRPHIVEK